MPTLLFLIVLGVGYLIGSLPMGYLYVKFFTGQDVRLLGSGRTGSTNVMRAAGNKVALLTGLSDGLKGVLAVRLAQYLLPDVPWAHVLAGVAAILGHNYSMFLGFKGGAGGGPTVGAASALWMGALFFIVPLGAGVWYFVGYASLTTISFAVIAIVVHFVRWRMGLGPLEYVYFGVLALALCLWSLRPNLKRLLDGTERLHGYRVRKLKSQ